MGSLGGIVEAAEVQGDEVLLGRACDEAVQMARPVYHEGLDTDGAVLYEATPHGVTNGEKHWWMQAEFAQQAGRLWQLVEAHFVDREYGEWFKVLRRDYAPCPNHFKVGPWECPYHHSRACFEMLQRLNHALE